MSFPLKTCVACGEEFELRPGKPGFANRCLECSTSEIDDAPQQKLSLEERKSEAEANEARRKAIRELLYSRK